MIPWMLAPAAASAAGYYLPNQDAAATARGNAFVATADTAAAVFYNPAGLTQLHSAESSVGIYSIQLGNRMTRPDGSSFRNDAEIQSVPQVFFGAPVHPRLAFGFGFNSPFGLGSSWGQNTPFHTQVTETRLTDVRATPALAWKATDSLSLGVSVSAGYEELLLAQGVGPTPDHVFRFRGNGTDWSGSLSARWQPSTEHAFGLVYATRTTNELKGTTSSDVFSGPGGAHGASMNFLTPQRFAAGYSYRPAPEWNFETNLEWLDWGQLDTLTLRTDALGTIGVPFKWKSGFIYEAGVTRELPGGWRVAAGYDYNCGVQPDATFNPGVCDADLQWINAGFGHHDDTDSWFVAYQFGFANHRVSGAATNLFGENTNGSYQSRHNSVFLNWRRKF